VGSEIGHLLRRKRSLRREEAPDGSFRVHFRRGAAPFLRRLYATASHGCDRRCAMSGVRLRSTRASAGQLESHGWLQGQRPVFVPRDVPPGPATWLWEWLCGLNGTGSKNRCRPTGRPRVRIPPPPLNHRRSGTPASDPRFASEADAGRRISQRSRCAARSAGAADRATAIRGAVTPLAGNPSTLD
jgi:hypothetical protein